MGFLTELFAGGASTLVDSIGNTLDKITTTKEEKMQLDLGVGPEVDQGQVGDVHAARSAPLVVS